MPGAARVLRAPTRRVSTRRNCSEVKSRGVMREGRACRGRAHARPVRTPRAEGGAGPSRADTPRINPAELFRSEIARRHAGGPRLSRPYPRQIRLDAARRVPSSSMPEISLRNKISSVARTVISESLIASAIKYGGQQRTQRSQSLCGLCVLCCKNSMFRCRIDRLRNWPCRGVEVWKERGRNTSRTSRRNCSEVKSRGVMREGRACRGRVARAEDADFAVAGLSRPCCPGGGRGFRGGGLDAQVVRVLS